MGDVPDDEVGFVGDCAVGVQVGEVHCTRGLGCLVLKTPSLADRLTVQQHCWCRIQHLRRHLRSRSMTGHSECHSVNRK